MLEQLCQDRLRGETYFATKAVNNSLLSATSNPFWIKWKKDNPEADKEEFRYFRIGAAVDCLLTDPDLWNDKFFVFTQSKPAGLMGIFIDNLPLYALNEENEPIHNKKGDLVSFKRDTELYQEAYDKAKYRIPIRTVIQNFWSDEKYLAYFRAREQANGKEIISIDEMDEVQNALSAIKKNLLASKFFTSYTQVPIYWNKRHESKGIIKQVPCKALLDFIYVDEENKEIYPGDLKTTASDVTDFKNSFFKFGYYRQAAWYDEAIVSSGLYKHYYDLGYKWMPFRFIVAPKKKDGMPALIYEISENTMRIGRLGNDEYKGTQELFKYLQWHEETGDYSSPKWIIDANFTFTL